ncbi:MAG: secretion protein HlyD [Sphingomonadales bacterium 32-68-7]|nr:MAG: secretion protein HlyD [Sphingomonadales bacterium 12-68-11]OYX09192.1 MAG: secretion protein HlyD [Sphingomonadales bacterium 32-68-7]
MNQMSVVSAPPSEDAESEQQQSLARSRKRAYAALAVLFFGLFLAAALIPIGGAVIGQGQLGVESRIKQISHPTGGVISGIYVRDGDRIRAGQLLMRLDTTVSGVSADLSAQTVDQLTAQRGRLTAEREGRGSIAFPPELLARDDPSAQAAMASERRLFTLRAQERAGLRSQLNERIHQLNEQIAGYRSQIGALQRQKVLIEPERQGIRELWEKDLVTIGRVNQLERTAADLDGSIGALEASIAQTRARISETQEQIISINERARAEAGSELAQVTAALNEQRVREASAGDTFDRSAIRAPYDGVVDKLAFATVGGVVPAAQTIMEIVPTQDALVVEAAISPADIDRVRIGQDTRVRLSAFSTQSTPEIPGKVIFVSAERAVNRDTGESFYRVRVRMDEGAVARERLALKAGMPAEVFISTGSRSMLSYVTKPLRDQFARAFTDD